MQESLEGEGDSKLNEEVNHGENELGELFFPLGKKAPFIGLQISGRLRSFRAQAVLPLHWGGSTASGGTTAEVPLEYRLMFSLYRELHGSVTVLER